MPGGKLFEIYGAEYRFLKEDGDGPCPIKVESVINKEGTDLLVVGPKDVGWRIGAVLD